MVQTFKDSANMEKKKDNNGFLDKISQLEESVDKLKRQERENSINNINNIKQIIWLGFDGPSDIYNEKLYLISQEVKSSNKSEDNKILLFTSSKQIISFFKYLFAIKPKLQFKNLEDKFVIVIECSGEEDNHEINKYKSLNYIINQQQLNQIYYLFDWLEFAGCKIPVAIFTPERLDKNIKMFMINNFSNLSFIDDKFDLNYFLKINIDNSHFGKSPKRRVHFSDTTIKKFKRLNLIQDIDLNEISKNNKKHQKNLSYDKKSANKSNKRISFDSLYLNWSKKKLLNYNSNNIPILENLDKNKIFKRASLKFTEDEI